MNRKVYCHTTTTGFWDVGTKLFISNGKVSGSHIKDTWYDVYHETDDLYIIQHFEHGNLIRGFYKHYLSEKFGPLFSDYFYTHEEYRDRKLNGLLNE